MRLIVSIASAVVVIVGCGDRERPRLTDPDPANPHDVHFIEVTDDAFEHRVLGGGTVTNRAGAGSGVALADFDGDGKLDMFLARYDDPDGDRPGGPSSIYWNAGAGQQIRFELDRAIETRFRGVRAHGVAVGDWDGDGDADIFVAAEGADTLLRNDGARRFTDVTGVTGTGGPNDDLSVGAVWFDANFDGRLDLYVVNFIGANRLHLNRGPGATMMDVGAVAGADLDTANWVAVVYDADRDGTPEILVGHDKAFGAGRDALLFQQSSDGPVPTYVDRGDELGVADRRFTMGMAIADVDGDGADDVYVTNLGRNELYLAGNGEPYTPATDAFDCSISAIAPDSGIDYPAISWGSRFKDFDRDGALELIVINGDTTDHPASPFELQQDRFLRQQEPGGVFMDITESAGLAVHPDDDDGPTGRAVVLGDLDGDGDDDMVVSSFLDPFRVFQNQTKQRGSYVRVRLGGTASSAAPVGAELRAQMTDGSVRRASYYAGGDVHSQGDDTLEVAVDDVALVASVWVSWPSGVEQRIDTRPEFAHNTTLLIDEPRWLELVQTEAGHDVVYTALDEQGVPLGERGAGRAVIFDRSDGVTTPAIDVGDGTYRASVVNTGEEQQTIVLRVVVDGDALRPRPTIFAGVL